MTQLVSLQDLTNLHIISMFNTHAETVQMQGFDTRREQGEFEREDLEDDVAVSWMIARRPRLNSFQCEYVE